MVCIRGEARAEVAEWQSEVMMAPTATKTRQSVAREDSTDLLGPNQVPSPHAITHQDSGPEEPGKESGGGLFKGAAGN